MLGKKSGVGQRLLEKYPRIILWHCLNHQLELSVGDAISEVYGANHFQVFVDKLYSLYSESPKISESWKNFQEGLGKRY